MNIWPNNNLYGFKRNGLFFCNKGRFFQCLKNNSNSTGEKKEAKRFIDNIIFLL